MAESSSSRNSVLIIRSVQNGGIQVENDILLICIMTLVINQ